MILLDTLAKIAFHILKFGMVFLQRPVTQRVAPQPLLLISARSWINPLRSQ